jgi:hypothetical protein
VLSYLCSRQKVFFQLSNDLPGVWQLASQHNVGNAGLQQQLQKHFKLDAA